MRILSGAFRHGERIPKKYTGEGEDVSPPLKLEGVPKEAKTIALIVDDPDAPMGTFDHWLVWNIPAETAIFSEKYKAPVEGLNHFQEERYRGPLPPPGPVHRYFFKAYALDTALSLKRGATKKELEKAIEGHILAEAELIGTYQR